MAENKITTNDDTKQYIVIQIGNEKYGIDISYIDNIIRMQKITRVPKAQPYFKGVINLRGDVVPVMSIRTKMGFEPDQFTHSSRILILKIEEHGLLGVIVDEVCEVVTLSENEIDRTTITNYSKKVSENFINGIGKKGDTLISLFEINAIISEREMN